MTALEPLPGSPADQLPAALQLVLDTGEAPFQSVSCPAARAGSADITAAASDASIKLLSLRQEIRRAPSARILLLHPVFEHSNLLRWPNLGDLRNIEDNDIAL